jgi:hypothetical protein
MGNYASRYEILSPASYEESISHKSDKLPTYTELFENKCIEINYKLKDTIIQYIVKNNISDLTLVELTDKDIVYLCKKEKILEKNVCDTYFINYCGRTIKFKECDVTNPVCLINICDTIKKNYTAVIYKQNFLTNKNISKHSL